MANDLVSCINTQAAEEKLVSPCLFFSSKKRRKISLISVYVREEARREISKNMMS